MDTLTLFAIALVILIPYYLHRKRVALRRFGLVSYRNLKFVGRFSADSVRAAAHKIGDEALLGAYHLPDTRDSAKQIIRDDLAARGYDDKKIAEWRRPIAELTAPPAAPGPIDPDHYFRLVRT